MAKLENPLSAILEAAMREGTGLFDTEWPAETMELRPMPEGPRPSAPRVSAMLLPRP